MNRTGKPAEADNLAQTSGGDGVYKEKSRAQVKTIINEPGRGEEEKKMKR